LLLQCVSGMHLHKQFINCLIFIQIAAVVFKNLCTGFHITCIPDRLIWVGIV